VLSATLTANMGRAFLIVISAVAAFAAPDDSWSKVRNLMTGTEVRVVKTDSVTPVIARFAELTDENLLVIVKNQELAIAKENIERVEYSPQKSRLTTESKSTTNSYEVDTTKPNPRARPSTLYSSGVSIADKVPFETIYRRTPTAVKK